MPGIRPLSNEAPNAAGASEHNERLLKKHDVRYVVLSKYTGVVGFTIAYWPRFKWRPGLYRVVFENEHVLIVVPHKLRVTISDRLPT